LKTRTTKSRKNQ